MGRMTWKRDLDGYEDVGLRDGVAVGDAICRLASYEDTGLEPNNPLALDQLREMDGEPVWVIPMRGSGGFCAWMLVDAEYELCREAHGEMAVFENCGKTWLAYRRKPGEGTQ